MGIDVTVCWESPVTGKTFNYEARIDWQFSNANFLRLCAMLGRKDKDDEDNASFTCHMITMEEFARLPLRGEVARHRAIKTEGPRTFTFGDIMRMAPVVRDGSRGSLYILWQAQRRMHRQRTRWRKQVRTALTHYHFPPTVTQYIAELASEWSDFEVTISAC